MNHKETYQKISYCFHSFHCCAFSTFSLWYQELVFYQQVDMASSGNPFTSAENRAPVTFSHPISIKLDESNNFFSWRQRVERVIRELDQVSQKYIDWEQQDFMLFTWLLSSLSFTILPTVIKCAFLANLGRNTWFLPGSVSGTIHSTAVTVKEYHQRLEKSFRLFEENQNDCQDINIHWWFSAISQSPWC